MKIAVTADLHLTTRSKHPERYNALENILEQMMKLGIRQLLMVGDTFDQSSQNYAEFENFCNQPKFERINFLLLPGNHDVGLNAGAMAAKNVKVVSAPGIWKPDETGLIFFLLPYVKNKTMGEYLSAISSELPEGKWILCAHGDWMDGVYEPDPAEPGIYMPLTRTDVQQYRPALAVLGHIHKPVNGDTVHYVGSPCGMHINETGRRRFFIVDSVTAAIESRFVETDVLYFNEAFVVVPVQDESRYLAEQISERIKAWQLQKSEFGKVRVRVKVSGYASNKQALHAACLAGFSEFLFDKSGGPDLDEVYLADDPNLGEIARLVKAQIEKVDLNSGLPMLDAEQILLHALHTIYGKKSRKRA